LISRVDLWDQILRIFLAPWCSLFKERSGGGEDGPRTGNFNTTNKTENTTKDHSVAVPWRWGRVDTTSSGGRGTVPDCTLFGLGPDEGNWPKNAENRPELERPQAAGEHPMTSPRSPVP